MKNYLEILRSVRDLGDVKVSAPRGFRTTPITTRSLFGVSFRHDMALGFPLLTTKKVNFKAVLAELLWFLSGDPQITELRKHTQIWNAWADNNDCIPSAYGVRWRNYRDCSLVTRTDFESRGLYGYALLDDTTDQIQGVLDLLIKDPSSRRGVVVAWDPRGDFSSALPPCHYTFVLNIGADNRVNLHVTMRSTDVPVGLPFNIASYAILLELFALWLGRVSGELMITMVDCHIYEDQLPGVEVQLARSPNSLPIIKIDQSLTLSGCNLSVMDKITLLEYAHQGFIHYPVAL